MILTHRNGQPVDATVPAVTEFASVTVKIERAPVELALQSGPPSVLRGQVEIEGDDTGLSPTALRFLPLDVRGSVQPAGVADDWSFRMSDLITTTRIGLASVQSGWWLKSFTVNGVNAAVDPVDFSGGRQSSDNVRAVIARTSRLHGRVTNGAGERASGTVVAFPVDLDRRYAGSPFVRTVSINAEGGYALELPPGQYFVAAVSNPGASGAAAVNLPLPFVIAALPSMTGAALMPLEPLSVGVTIGEAEVTRDLQIAQMPK
jgi:hypothetical protein